MGCPLLLRGTEGVKCLLSMPSSYRFTFDSYWTDGGTRTLQVTAYTIIHNYSHLLNQISQATATLPHSSLASQPRHGDSVLAARCNSARALEAEKKEDDLWVSEHLHGFNITLCLDSYRFNKSLYGAPNFYTIYTHPMAPWPHPFPSTPRVRGESLTFRLPPFPTNFNPPPQLQPTNPKVLTFTKYPPKPASSVPAQLVGRANRGCRPRYAQVPRFATCIK